MVSSTASLKQELQEVDIVLHEGSTLAVEALVLGVPVIHVDLNDIASWDSLFECKRFRWVVTREEYLPKTIELIYSLSDGEYYRQQAQARQYIEDLANEVTEQRLNDFILQQQNP